MRTFYSKAAMLVLSGAVMVALSACGGSSGVPSESGAGDIWEPKTETCLENLGYGTVTLANGSIWLDRNLGASDPYAGDDYNNSASFGDYYQWGRGNDGHEKVNSETINTLATETAPAEGQEWFGKFISELSAVPKVVTSFDWVDQDVDDNGSIRSAAWNTPRPDEADASEPLASICPCGFVVPSAQDFFDANLTTAPNELDLPIAGYRDFFDSEYKKAGEIGVYWTRDPSENGNGFIIVSYDSATKERVIEAIAEEDVRGFAAPIRCIKKESSVDTPEDFEWTGG